MTSCAATHSGLPTISVDRVPFPAWGEREIGRFNFRVALFTRRGWDRQKAEAWADRLFERDHERDDRRLCIECAHLRRSGGCFAASQGQIPGASRYLNPVTDVMARCSAFKWSTPQ